MKVVPFPLNGPFTLPLARTWALAAFGTEEHLEERIPQCRSDQQRQKEMGQGGSRRKRHRRRWEAETGKNTKSIELSSPRCKPDSNGMRRLSLLLTPGESTWIFQPWAGALSNFVSQRSLFRRDTRKHQSIWFLKIVAQHTS